LQWITFRIDHLEQTQHAVSEAQLGKDVKGAGIDATVVAPNIEIYRAGPQRRKSL